ncbi:Chaperonin CPN60-like 2, mitochondrial [Capsicum chinense]|nr:Chaperonin CPN60-like 2, mitochondrial [Capsicum chinense]
MMKNPSKLLSVLSDTKNNNPLNDEGSISRNMLSKLFSILSLECFKFYHEKGKYEQMVKAGIIDLVKVVRTALVDAASVSLILTTTEAAILDRLGEINPLANRMPNMGDMY